MQKMTGCPDCATHSSRHHRGVFEKIVSRAAFRCDQCGAKSYYYRAFLAIFQPYCQCPVCHSRDVRKLASRDPLDRMSRNPLRRILILFGCPLYHCTFCRLQFREWRSLDPKRAARPQKRAEAG
jgi:hypothetical protein